MIPNFRTDISEFLEEEDEWEMRDEDMNDPWQVDVPEDEWEMSEDSWLDDTAE